MSGIFGFVSTGGAVDFPFFGKLLETVTGAGPDSWSLAWRTVAGRLEETKHAGQARGRDLPGAILGAVWILGHCQLGRTPNKVTPQPFVDSHPPATDPLVLVMDGELFGAQELATAFSISNKTGLPGEILCRYVADDPQTVAGQCMSKSIHEFVTASLRPPKCAVLAARGMTVSAVGRGMEIFILPRPEGLYLTTRPPDASWRPADGVGYYDFTAKLPPIPAHLDSEKDFADQLQKIKVPGARTQPLDTLQWLERDAVRPNDYNPNKQPPSEFRLLKVSLLEDGWTQPIVAFDAGDGTKPVIVDGAHRWAMSADPEVAAMTGGKIPVVLMTGDLSHRMCSTVRHNRARGEHIVHPMAEIVRNLLAKGNTIDDVCFYLQMEREEVTRLVERGGSPDRVAREHGEFTEGWKPS